MESRSYECVDCRAKSPAVETEYTLISSRFGWRLNRRVGRDGALVLEWRCPTCWTKFKAERGVDSGPVPPSSSRKR
jgi:DNA-directed RNA polymerase subunit RPC12/RpoP